MWLRLIMVIKRSFEECWACCANMLIARSERSERGCLMGADKLPARLAHVSFRPFVCGHRRYMVTVKSYRSSVCSEPNTVIPRAYRHRS
jgi:hypothetical protein